MTTKEALELMANVCKLGDIIDRQKIDLQSATLRAERAEADLAAAREDVARMDKALRRIATMECHSEGGIPVTPSELREIARDAIDSARVGGSK